MITVAIFMGAAVTEIVGCVTFLAWLRMDKSALWLAPGPLALALFAYLLTLVESPSAGARIRRLWQEIARRTSQPVEAGGDHRVVLAHLGEKFGVRQASRVVLPCRSCSLRSSKA